MSSLQLARYTNPSGNSTLHADGQPSADDIRASHYQQWPTDRLLAEATSRFSWGFLWQLITSRSITIDLLVRDDWHHGLQRPSFDDVRNSRYAEMEKWQLDVEFLFHRELLNREAVSDEVAREQLVQSDRRYPRRARELEDRMMKSAVKMKNLELTEPTTEDVPEPSPQDILASHYHLADRAVLNDLMVARKLGPITSVAGPNKRNVVSILVRHDWDCGIRNPTDEQVAASRYADMDFAMLSYEYERHNLGAIGLGITLETARLQLILADTREPDVADALRAEYENILGRQPDIAQPIPMGNLPVAQLPRRVVALRQQDSFPWEARALHKPALISRLQRSVAGYLSSITIGQPKPRALGRPLGEGHVPGAIYGSGTAFVNARGFYGTVRRIKRRNPDLLNPIPKRIRLTSAGRLEASSRRLIRELTKPSPAVAEQLRRLARLPDSAIFGSYRGPVGAAMRIMDHRFRLRGYAVVRDVAGRRSTRSDEVLAREQLRREEYDDDLAHQALQETRLGSSAYLTWDNSKVGNIKFHNRQAEDDSSEDEGEGKGETSEGWEE